MRKVGLGRREMAEPKKASIIASTDLTKWRLKNERGRQTWWYDANGEFVRDSNFVELHSLGLDTVRMQHCYENVESQYYVNYLCLRACKLQHYRVLLLLEKLLEMECHFTLSCRLRMDIGQGTTEDLSSLWQVSSS